MPSELIWLVEWWDDWCIMDGACPRFVQSVHKTRKGAEAEAKRLRGQAKGWRRGGKITSHYAVVKGALLP